MKIFFLTSYSLPVGKLVWVAWVNESRKFPKTLGLLNGPDNTYLECLGGGSGLFLFKGSMMSQLVQIHPKRFRKQNKTKKKDLENG